MHGSDKLQEAFKTQAEAKRVYDRCRDAGQDMDAFDLDRDNDGLICEALPLGAD